jgi:hypothetical protein
VQLRVARYTERFDEVVAFYRDELRIWIADLFRIR